MGTVQKLRTPKYDIPGSEPFRIYLLHILNPLTWYTVFNTGAYTILSECKLIIETDLGAWHHTPTPHLIFTTC